VANQAAADYLPHGRVEVTGYPVREQFRTVAADRAAARERFHLLPDAPVLCVFGGSQGARAINAALGRHLEEILDRLHVIHIAGEKRFQEAQEAASGLTQTQRDRYLLFPYLHDEDMAAALAASDLALCRSGASTLGELPAAGLPAILVPLPDPAVHQRENADVLAAAGAAITVEERELDTRLVPLLGEMLGDKHRLAAMSAAARALDRPDAIDAIARLVLSSAAP
jgi:UDP-N-acetylglucosamine--N-acetylmuramyl-(pentapeptide) pyrophosphoryl-undecaprenol N-acetylglucosamine transferase